MDRFECDRMFVAVVEARSFSGAADGEAIAVPVTGRLHYSNAEACLGAAEAGLGLAYVPSFVAGPAIAARKVRALLTAFSGEPFGIHALYPHSRHLAAKARVLVDLLAARYRGQPHWEVGWQADLPQAIASIPTAGPKPSPLPMRRQAQTGPGGRWSRRCKSRRVGPLV